MSLTALQGASIIASHALFTKLALSLTLRVYQFLEPDPKRRESIENSHFVQQYQKAQKNESEYAGLLVSLLLFLSANSTEDPVVAMATKLSVVGQIGYVWSRAFLGYPKIPSITMAVVRYGGLALLCWSLHQLAFASQ